MFLKTGVYIYVYMYGRILLTQNLRGKKHFELAPGVRVSQ